MSNNIHNSLSILLAAASLLGSMTSCHDDEMLEGSSLSTTRGNAGADYKTNLLRSYGVGYGYDATGEYASYNSVRDCVIDQQQLLLEDPNIFTDNYTPRVDMNVVEGFDSKDLATNLTAQAGLKIDLGIFFEAEVSATYTKSTLKTDNYSFCTINNNYIKVSRHMDPYQVRALAAKNENVLSKGFLHRINLISKLKKRSDQEMSIDTLLMHYGTHFIYQASLGGSLHFNSVFTRSSLGEASSLTIEAKAQLAGICGFDYKDQSGTGYKQRQTMTSHTLTAIGGDVTCCSAIVKANGESSSSDNPDGYTKIDKQIIENWYKSINFDPESQYNSNVELVDFRLAPIYELIPDTGVRNLVAERFGIYRQSAEEQMPLPANQIFCKIPFDIIKLDREEYFFCRIRDKHQQVIAEVVKEQAEVDGELKKFTTVYPVIDGRVAEEGISYSRYNDSLYVVSWMEDSVHIASPLMDYEDLNSLYYNNGQLGVRAITGHDYEEITEANLDTDNAVYCWDGYYGTDEYPIYKVGRYYIMPGPKLKKQSGTENYDNDYMKVLADPPYGWQFAKSSCGIFHQCKNYLDEFISNQDDSFWMDNDVLFLPSPSGEDQGMTTYNFYLFDQNDKDQVYVINNGTEVTKRLTEGNTHVLMVRNIPYYYR